MIEKWGLIIAWDISNDCYIASVPELLACTGAGQTRQEALEALEQEVEHWLRTSYELGRVKSVPETQTLKALPTEKPQPVRTVGAEAQAEASSGSRDAIKVAKRRLELSEPHTYSGLTITSARNLPIILLAGEGNLLNSPSLKQACGDVLDTGEYFLVLDLTELIGLDSAILAVMLGVVKKFNGKDGLVIVVKSKNEAVNRVFAVTRLDSIFWMCNTLDEAIEKLDTLPVLPNQEQVARDLS